MPPLTSYTAQIAFSDGPAPGGYVGIKACPRALFAGAADGKVAQTGLFDTWR